MLKLVTGKIIIKSDLDSSNSIFVLSLSFEYGGKIFKQRLNILEDCSIASNHHLYYAAILLQNYNCLELLSRQNVLGKTLPDSVTIIGTQDGFLGPKKFSITSLLAHE